LKATSGTRLTLGSSESIIHLLEVGGSFCFTPDFDEDNDDSAGWLTPTCRFIMGLRPACALPAAIRNPAIP
jgi:hypothetical protein